MKPNATTARMNPPSTLRLLLTNAFGLLSKVGEFQHSLMLHSPDIAIVTETKLTTEKATSAELTFPGYYPPIRRDRTAFGGGIAVWVKEGIAYRHLSQLDEPDHEMLWVSVKPSRSARITLCAGYRPPSQADTSFMEHLDSVLAAQTNNGSDTILAGDFNVHNTEWLGSSHTSTAGQSMEDLCALHGLSQHVRTPTRGANVLDLVMSSFCDTIEGTTYPPLGKSDHCVVITDFPLGSIQREPRTVRQVWRYAKADWPRLSHHFATLDWDTLISDDPDSSCLNVTSAITKGMQTFIPSKQLSSRPTDPPWWTPECTRYTQAKRTAWKALQKNLGSVQRKEAYKSACAASTAYLSRAKNLHLECWLAQMEMSAVPTRPKLTAWSSTLPRNAA